MRGLNCFFLVLTTLVTLPIAYADTTILERDRSDRQAPAQTFVPDKPPQHQNLPAPKQEIAPFQPFVMKRIEIEGSTMSKRKLAMVTSPFVGTMLDQKAVQTIAQNLAAAYAASDIALYTVIIGNQDGAGGVLRILVIEGRVDQVKIDGDVSPDMRERAQAILDPVTKDAPLHKQTSERTLALLKSTPGLGVQTKFLRTDQRGVVTMAPTLSMRRFEGGIGVTTRGSSSLGRTQLQADFSANSIVRAGDRTTLSFATPTNFENFRYYGLSHQTPLGTNGLSLSANAGYLTTRPDGSSTRGKAIMAGMQLSYPVILSFTRALTLGLGMDGLNSDNAFLGESVTGDYTRAARLSASYVLVDGRKRLGATVALARGIDGLGARASSPTITDLDFFKVSGQVTYAFPLSEEFAVRLATAGQYSDDRVPGAEQSSLGGEKFGRAFEGATVTGDSSAAASAEIAYLVALPSPMSDGEIYAFIDGGQIWRNARGVIAATESGVASVGFGARVTVLSQVALGVEFAHPLDAPDTDPDPSDWHAVFSVSSRFNP